MDLSEVAVVIPAYNEEESLPLVLRDLPDVGRVIVANNGSTDRTAEVAEAAGAVVVAEPRKGYGAACLAGLSELKRRIEAGETAPKIVAFVDADYSDHPDQLPELLAPIYADEADFVLGSRLLGQREPGAMPPQSIYGNRLACWLMRVLFGAQYTDLGPFRAITYPELCRLEMADTNFGWTVEMQIKAAKAGLRTLEVPVCYRKRIGASKISGTVRGTILAGGKILYTIAKYGLWQRQTLSQPSLECNAECNAAGEV
ncbi:MAG: glycosyltransferase family 2 protein [Planctomycetes bacterium]|nr:glycosyltransferase family 2 protein [Planctomycetota bacterium]